MSSFRVLVPCVVLIACGCGRLGYDPFATRNVDAGEGADGPVDAPAPRDAAPVPRDAAADATDQDDSEDPAPDVAPPPDAGTPDANGPIDAREDALPCSGAGCGLAGLLGYWSFDEASGTHAFDRSGQGNDGDFVSAVARAPGRVGGAINVDEPGHVVVPASRSLDTPTRTTGLTLAAWVKHESRDGLEYHAAVSRQVRDDSVDLYALFLRGRDLAFSCGQVDSRQVQSTSPVVELNEWHHIAASYDGTTARLYVDGRLVGMGPLDCPLGPTQRPLVIAGNLNGPLDPALLSLRGLVDEVYLFARTLPQEEIALLSR